MRVSTNSGGVFDSAKLRERLEELERRASVPNLWDDRERAEQVLRELVALCPDDLEPRSALLRLRSGAIEDPALAADLEGLLETLERQDLLRDWEKLA